MGQLDSLSADPGSLMYVCLLSMDKCYDVVVVGGGFAGVTAARELAAGDTRSIPWVGHFDSISGLSWQAGF